MTNESFKLRHESATTEKALEAATRVEAAFGRYVGGQRNALVKVDGADYALLVQHVRNHAAGPDPLQTATILLLQAQVKAAESKVEDLTRQLAALVQTKA